MSLRHTSATTATLQRGRSREAPPGLTLVPISEDREPITLDRALVLGRDPSCDVVLDDIAASREHARITPTTDGACVEDLASRNGVFVGGKAIANEVVKVGGVVRIGNSVFRVAALREAWARATEDSPLVGGIAMAMVRRTIGLIGPTDVPVLILGETGTGKEVAARMIGAASQRSGPFVAVNCAAVPENLVDSEMFGHVRGAFSGADRARAGLFVAADGGTLFLDEVGDLPLAAQAKLLRVLEDGLVRPVGSEKSTKVDVRVISATNADLHAAVEAGRFRSDLLARLGAVELHMPSLRDRPEDLPAIVRCLLRRGGRPPLQLGADALEAMACYAWPRNVRELDHCVRSITVHDREITLDDLPAALNLRIAAPARAKSESTPPTRRDRDSLVDALIRHRGNVRQVGLDLGIARGQLYRLLDRYRLDPAQYRSGTDVAGEADVP
jgi:DNA-binding NtrC family response regulator